MKDKQVVLVTGVSEYWGAHVAEKLLLQTDLHVIGLDSQEPTLELKGLDFIQADIRNPLLVELLKSEAVQTVCHLKFVDSARPSEACFDLNVIGTMKLLGACAEAGVGKVIIKSSTAVYGAHPDNSAFLTEETPLRGSRAYGYTRDLVEIEAFCNGFRRQVPELCLTILRFPNIIGLDSDTPMTRFLKEPRTPVLLGFDPMMQVIHEGDVIEAIVHAVINNLPGVYNVAAETAMVMSRLMGLAGKFPIPVFHLFAYWGTAAFDAIGETAHIIPIELDYIRYPWVGDLRKMREDMGFTPRYTAEEALREFAGWLRVSKYRSEASVLAYDEERLRDTMDRRRRWVERSDDVKNNEEDN